jgi:tetratricopeptide (TPR) repeat protein
MTKMTDRAARAAATLLLVVLVTGCGRDQNAMVDELLSLEEETYKDRELSEATVEELLESIEVLEEEVVRTVDAGERLVTSYTMVGVAYMERELYGLAEEFFRKVLDYQPRNRLVVYRLGLCSSQVALSIMEPEARSRELEEAEDYYLYALTLDTKYDEALYALAVLYIFEMDKASEAEPYLLRLLEGESRHFEGMFLLARVYVLQGRIDDAIALYDRIIDESNNDGQVRQATLNRQRLGGGIDGR